jgi:hypothetical protein
MQEAIDLLGGPAVSDERQRRAAEALGVLHKLPDPQAELCLPQSQATRPPTVAASPDPKAPYVRRASLTLEPDRAA